MSSHFDIESLIASAKAGDRDAFEGLARTYLRPAYLVALAVVRRPADAEDVAQDALISAFERLDTCREPSRYAAWLMTIVRNQARNWLEKRRLRDVLPTATEERNLGLTDGAEPSIQRETLLRAMETLNPAEREVVLLHDLEGYTHEEIAGLLGVSCVMSRQHLFVSRRKLRHALGITASERGNDE